MFGGGFRRRNTEMQKEFPVMRVRDTVRTAISYLLVVTGLTVMILIIALW
jgi:hypothetical protein